MSNEQLIQTHLNGRGLSELKKFKLPSYTSFTELQSSGNRFGIYDKYFAYIDHNGAWQKVLLDVDIDTAIDLGGANTSDSKLSSQKAVKAYVDNIQTALNNAITTAVSNATNSLTAQMNNLRKITPWKPSNPFPTVRSSDGQPFKEGDFVQITEDGNGYKAGDIIIAKIDGASSESDFVDKAETTDIATDSIYGTVRLIKDLAELNSNLPDNDSKVITQAVLKSKIDEVVASIQTSYQAADTALQSAITTAYTQAIETAKTDTISLFEAADTALQSQITSNTQAITALQSAISVLQTTVTNQETRITNIETVMPKGVTVQTSTVGGTIKSVTHAAGKKARMVTARDLTDGSLLELSWEVDNADVNNKINILTLGSMSNIELDILCY